MLVDDGPPKPTDWLQAVATAVTAAAVIVGGGLAYRRLRHSGGFQPMLQLAVSANPATVSGIPGLHVNIAVTNTGQSTLLFDRASYDYRLRVVEVASDAWLQAATGNPDNEGLPRQLYWDGARHVDVEWMRQIKSARTLESGLLFPTPEERAELSESAQKALARLNTEQTWLRPNQSFSRDLLVPGFSGAEGHLLVITAQVCDHAGLGRRWRHRHWCTRDGNMHRRTVFYSRTLVMNERQEER